MLDADADEQALFSKVRHLAPSTPWLTLTLTLTLTPTLTSKVRHLPYYTVASFITLPWLASNAVYYLGDHQVRVG